MPNFSKRLKAYRLSRGLTQKQLAELVGVSQNAVYNWENGKREPTLATIIKLANILNTNVLKLTGEVGEDELGIYITQPDGSEHFYSGEQVADPAILDKVSDYDRQHIIESRDLWPLMISPGLRPKYKLLNAFNSLNESGQQKAIEQVEMLTKIPEYRADPQPPAAESSAPSDQDE